MAQWFDQLRKNISGAEFIAGDDFDATIRLNKSDQLKRSCQLLKDEFQLDQLEDYTALHKQPGFILVLHLVSTQDSNKKLTLKLSSSDESQSIDSLMSVYPSANWYEREIYDMFGIKFSGHPDLRRLLLPEDWKGHPLRKDYEDDKLLKRP